VTKDVALSLIMTGGYTPSGLGSMAHRILDYVWLGPQRLMVKTPRNDWHPATKREIELIGDIITKSPSFEETVGRQQIWHP